MRRVAWPVLLALAAAPVARAQDTVIVRVGADLTANRLDTITIPIVVDMRKAGAAKLGSYTIRVSWDGTALRYPTFGNVRTGAFATPVVREDSAIYYGRNALWLAAVSAAGKDGLVHLADVRLVVDSARADTIRLSVTELSAAGTLVNLLTTATIQVQSGGFCPGLGRWGDLDGDRLANSRDALAILSDIVDLPVDPAFNLGLGDVDGDGKVNSRDALILLSYAVGLPITGQRILLVVAGSCASGEVPGIVVLPDTADLVPGQQVQLMGYTRNAAGDLTALSGLMWQTADPAVALVDRDGTLLARQPGVTTVAAQVGPGTRLEAPVIVRSRRGTWYADVQRAAGNPIQLGTMKWPFADPWKAFELLADGDTVRVAPGTYDQREGCYYTYYCYIAAGAVVLGDTLPDGTRPRLRYAGTGPDRALYFYPYSYAIGAPPDAGGAARAPQAGTTRAEVKNLVLENFYAGIQVDGLRNLLVDNVTILERGGGYGYGIQVYAPMDTLRVRRSQILGDSAQFSYYGIYLSDGALLVEVRDTELSHWGYGAIYGYDVDSLDVQRSRIRRSNSYTIFQAASDQISVSAVLTDNRFEDNQSDGVYIDDARTVVLRRNVHGNRYDDIQVYGPYTGSGLPVPGAKLVIVGDSVRHRQSGYYWLDARRLDSVLVDSVVVTSTPDTATNWYSYVEANHMRVRESRFLDTYGGTPIDFYGKRLVVSNSQFIGCNVCNWDYGDAIRASDFSGAGPSVTVTNSTFRQAYRAVYAYGYQSQGGPVTLAGNTVDSVSRGFDVYADSVTISDNVMSRLRYMGAYVEPSNYNNPYTEARLLRNQVSCHPVAGGTGVGLRVYYNGVRSEQNAVRNCSYGVSGYQYSGYPLVNFVSRGDTVFPRDTSYYHVGIRVETRVRATIVGARVVGGYVGIDLSPTDTAAARIDSSAVSGTGLYGIQLYYINAPVVGVRNNIAGNRRDGIYNVGGSGLRSFTLGKFNSGGVGNGRYAVSSATAFDARQNWWGSPNGAGGFYGSGLQDADSVSSAAVDDTLHLTSEPSDVPPLSPPAAAARGAWSPAAAAEPGAAPPPATAEDPAAAHAVVAEQAAARRAAREARDREQTAKLEGLRRAAEEHRVRHVREREEASARSRRPR
ncbi:MAG TPA: right-handed parallel beta-helix repeat-containing protein [Gemmatimonadales bacterium]|nr:right-handed parallel beta-helix repeat-containing protein [Gemmatimonadales bacterium]